MSATPTDSDTMPLPSTKKSSKTGRAKRTIIILKLASDILSNFPCDLPPSKSSRARPPITVTPSQNAKPVDAQDDAQDDDDDDDAALDKDKTDQLAGAADAASTPNPSEANGESSLAPPAVNGLKRRGGPGSRSDPSKKSSVGTDADGNPKPRGKPGPKRRKGLDADGTKGLWTAPAPLNHKLGPKANQGDINARLRALDRSGNPCRKWQRKGLQLSTFHGVKWDMAGWKTNKTADSGFDGDVKSDSTGSNSDTKLEPASSNVASEKSNGRADSNAPPASTTDHASSPAPARAVETMS